MWFQNGKNTLITQHLDPLPFDQYQQFRQALGTRSLVMRQQYPCRLMTGAEDHDWLLLFFQPMIDQFAPGQPLQQIFVSLELPGARFMMHRSHPNIQQVLVYSPYHNLYTLDYLTQPAPDAPDYWTPPPESAVIQVPLPANCLLSIDAAQALHWGQAAAIPLGGVQQLVWIYLG